MSDFSRLLAEKEIEFNTDVRLCEISSFKIGGVADYVVYPDTEEKLIFAVSLARSLGIRYSVVGNTSNVLFSDKGFSGMILVTRRLTEFSFVQNDGENLLICGAGAMLPVLSKAAAERSLSALEFACGIPATVGGAVYMNAGAHGGQMSDILISSRAYDVENNTVCELLAVEHGFSYRHSIYMNNDSLVCLGAKLSLTIGEKCEIVEKMKKYSAHRRSTQPLAMASAGSYFKRPDGYIAAKLIDECGLKGYRIGGACVSDMHAGFIVNLGGATSEDVLSLEEYVREKVYSCTGVTLEREVRLVE